jgi:hypothetical protein
VKKKSRAVHRERAKHRSGIKVTAQTNQVPLTPSFADCDQVERVSEELGEFVPYDENLLERTRTQWQFGDWESLTKLERNTLQHHPDRAKLALLVAAGHMQQGDTYAARQFTRLAQDWGCSKKLVSQILIAGVHNSLGRAAAVIGQQPRALQHFESAISIGTPGSEVHLIAQARVVEQIAQLRLPSGTLSLQILRKHREYLSVHGLLHSGIASAAHKYSGEQRVYRPCIVVAGMRHSGTTVLFNIIRLALEKKKINFFGFYSEGKGADCEDQAGKGIRLIKTHEFRDDIIYQDSIVITTRRDLRDTVASATRRKFPLLNRIGGAVEYAKYNRMLHDVWLPLSDYVFVYESFMSDPIVSIANLLQFFGLEDVDQKEIYKEVLSLPVDQYETTLLSPIHITDPERKLSYKDTLDDSLIKKINLNHSLWLDRYGYSIESDA